MGAQTTLENISLERTRIVNRAVSESIEGVPALKAVRSGLVGEGGQASNGYYDDTDVWVGWWKAGMTVGSAPIRPSRS